MLALDHILCVGGAQGKEGEGGGRSLFRKKKFRHVFIGFQPGFLSQTAHQFRLIHQDHPAMVSHLQKQMAHKSKVIAAVFCLGKILVVFHGLAENPAVNLFQRSVGHKIPLQVRLKQESFIGILRIQVRAEEIIQLICFQAAGGIEQHLAGRRAVGGKLFQLLGDPRLQSPGQIGILHDPAVDQVQLVHGRLFAERQKGNHHIFLVGHVKYRIQKMGFSLPVFSGDNHAAGFSLLADQSQTVRDFFHNLWPGVGKILSHRPGRYAGTQGFDHMSRFKIIHALPPLPSHSGSAGSLPRCLFLTF